MKKRLLIQIKNELLDDVILVKNKIESRIKFYNIKTDKANVNISFHAYHGNNILKNETTILIKY